MYNIKKSNANKQPSLHFLCLYFYSLYLIDL